MKKDSDDIFYGRTPTGQLLYDLLFTELPEKYLARKHKMPIARIRSLRIIARQAYTNATAQEGQKECGSH